jgi:hypothetical protein
MSAQADLIAELMARVRRTLFKGREAEWFPAQEMVKKALTLPARHLRDQGVPFPIARYRQVLELILGTIEREGDIARLVYPAGYLFGCVQKHLQHHGHHYYEEGKSLRNSLDHLLVRTEAKAAARQAAEDNTVAILAATHDAIQVGRRKPKAKAVSASSQQSLL